VEMLTSVQNPLVKQLAGLKEKKGRDGTGLFLIEGVRFVEEALGAGAEIVQVVYSPRLTQGERGCRLLESFGKVKIPVLSVSEKVLAHVADTETPQGIAAAVRIPQVSLDKLNGELFLIVDEVQDPGNLGSIIRSSLAAGAGGVVCTRGTVDAYNPKTLRSTMGAVFGLPVVQGIMVEELLQWLSERWIPLVVADSAGDNIYYESKLIPPLALVIGNEGQGPNRLMLENAALKIRIPLYGRVESLNAAVAAALLLFESARQAASRP